MTRAADKAEARRSPIRAAELLTASVPPAPRYPCGHERTPENTTKQRRCVICHREAALKYRVFPKTHRIGDRLLYQSTCRNLVAVRDGVAVHPCAIKSLVKLRLVFWDDSLKRYRCDPLILAPLNAKYPPGVRR